ncbi:hypothetical protein MMC34_008620 [Xylographa carneopallida]|nr:hypothetical protein [Xylographa carneopallida]
MSSEPLISPTSARSSSLTLYAIRGRGELSSPHDLMHFCSFTNVLVRHDAATSKSYVSLRFTSRVEWQRYTDAAAQCWQGGGGSGQENKLCRPCFHPQFMFAVHPYEFDTDVAALPPEQWEAHRTLPDPFAGQEAIVGGADSWSQFDHTWGVHKWVRHPHVAHWTQKLLMFQSVWQHAPLFADRLPPVDSMLFHDTDSGVNEHMQVILNASLASALDDTTLLHNQATRIVWASDIEQRSAKGGYVPLRRYSMTPHYGIFATHSDDTIAFRSSVYEHFHLPPLRRCPPPQITFLYRENRHVLNRQAILDWIRATYRVDAVVATTNGEMSSAEQVALFARTGLMIASHSSQVVNVVFSQPGSAVVEVAPEFYNADFAEYAHGMGVFFQYALGGEVDRADAQRREQPLHEECVRVLSACEGFSWCVVRERYKCPPMKEPGWNYNANKNLAFNANMSAVQQAIKNAMGHLDWLCDGQFTQQRRPG